MKAPKSLLLIALIAIFSACSDKNEIFIGDWEGEYVATDSLGYVSSDGNMVDGISRESSITIFRDKNLYVQTLGLGNPFNPKKDPVDHTIIVRAPSRVKNGTMDEIEEGDPEQESGIENVETTPKNIVVLMNGGVFSIYNGKIYASKAIKVISSTENQLVLRQGKKFDVTITNVYGDKLEKITCNWTYTPIQKQSDVCSWTADLHMNSTLLDYNTIRHIITMSKK